MYDIGIVSNQNNIYLCINQNYQLRHKKTDQNLNNLQAALISL